MASALLRGLVLVAMASSAFAAPKPWEPKTLDCTPWSWAVCEKESKHLYKVMVNKDGGGGMQAPGHFINGEFSLDMQLPKGNTGGVNFAWYLMDTISKSNKDPLHSELDMEFYGNKTSKDIMLALNVFCNGKQNLAQYRLPFDSAAKLHTYTIRWSSTQIAWLVDGTPLRVLNKLAGKPWPRHAMKPMATVWATPWTTMKADFSNGPVTALYGNYKATGCKVGENQVQKEPTQCAGAWNAPLAPAQMDAYKAYSAKTLIVEYGWDKI